MIRFENISKVYTQKGQQVVALEGLDLGVDSGEFVALLGPSGSGKTTTLSLLCGFLKPTEGHIYFDDRPVDHLEPRERNIGMGFQSYALYPHLSVLDNIAFPLKQKKIDKKTRCRQAGEIAEKLQIESLLTRKPSQLSGGQQQRVALARALVKKPVILLLDEPMSNLDARLKLDVREELKRIQQAFGVTTILVTHDQEEAFAVADRVAVLDKGRMQQYDTPHALYAKPRNRFVASFLGSPPMNFVDGALETRSGETWFVCPGFAYRWPAARPLCAPSIGDRVTLGIRPSHIKLAEPGADTLEMTIDSVENLSGSQLLRAADAKNAVSLRLVRAYEAEPVKKGETVHLRFEDEHVHLFEAAPDGVCLS